MRGGKAVLPRGGDLSARLSTALRDSIDQTRIDAQVRILRDALLANAEFHVLYW